MIPKSHIPTEKVTLSGGEVEVRGLTVNEMEAVRKLSGAAQNILSIAYSTGFSHVEVRDWYHSDETSAADVGKLCDAIARLAGLGQDATFPGATRDDAVVQQPTT